MEHQLETGSVFLIGRWEWRTAKEHGSYYLGRLRAVNGGMDSSSIHYVNTMKITYMSHSIPSLPSSNRQGRAS